MGENSKGAAFYYKTCRTVPLFKYVHINLILFKRKKVKELFLKEDLLT